MAVVVPRFLVAVAVAALAASSAARAHTDALAVPDGSTPLQAAVFRGDVAEVKRLIASRVDVKQPNDYGVTAMELAAETGNTEMLQALLAAGADVESPNGEGQTALMSVARTGNVEAARLLIKRGANVNATERFGGQTALMWAAARRHPEMVELLASKGADTNARAIVRNFERHITVEQRYKNTHVGGLTPLLYAARENCKACIGVLLKHRADISLPDPEGVPALAIALSNGNWDVAKALVEAGADVNQWDLYGQSPLHIAIENAYVTPRGGLANAGTDKTPNATDGKAVVRMLVERGADPNQQMFFRPPRDGGFVVTSTRGTTPFHRACAANDPEIVKYLLAHGADIGLATAHGETPMMASINGRGREDDILATLKTLHEAGADPKGVQQIIYYNRNRGGSTLHFATRKGLKKVMAELVAYGADPNAKDQDGLTSLDYAMSRGWLSFLTTRPAPRMDLAKTLKELGATTELAKTPDWPGEFPPIGPPRQHEAEIWPL